MHKHPALIADADGVIVFWNAAAERAFGHGAAAALGQTLDLIVPADFREAHWRGFRAAMQSGHAEVEGQATPFPAQQADGVIAERPGRLTLLRAPDGGAIGAMVVFD
ncbi:PAS domain-containing protein [Caulobacter sp. KR2-114]|uniref:PAS domain-containing protein n=1 Tax=Caulobacter sp. KR2-114 TaxID=3400912 RepID=UPI003C0C4698